MQAITLSQNGELPELYETISPPMTLNLGVMLVFWALLSFMTEGEFEDAVSDIELSGLPRKRKSNRFFYMQNTPTGLKTVSRTEAELLKSQSPNALYSVWALDADQAREKIQQGKGENYSSYQQNLDFAGNLLNCVGWQKVINKKGDEITRCFVFQPNCKTKSCIKDTEERKADGWKPRVSPKKNLQGYYTSCKSYFRNAAGHLKCAKYGLTCNPDAECSPTKAHIPWSTQEIEYSEKAIKSVARTLADEMNHTIDDTKRIMRIVQEYGGIAPYAKGYQSEEYKDIPTKYKNKEGIKIDELAQEIGLTESALVDEINKAEDVRLRLPKGKRRFSVKDMMFDAENYLRQQESEGFAGLRRKDRPKMDRGFVNAMSQAFLGLGKYKSYDINESIEAAAKWLKKYGKEKVYLVPTAYKGYQIDDRKPGYGQQYYEITNTGKVTEYIYKPGKGIVPGKSKQMFSFKPESPKRERTESAAKEKSEQMTLFGTKHISPYFKKNTNDVWFIDEEPIYSNYYKDYRHQVYKMSKGKYIPAPILLSPESLSENFEPGLLEKKYKGKQQLTLFGTRFKADITEHQIRSRTYNPKKIVKGTYFTRASTTPGVSYVMGQDDRSGKFVTQSIRFDKKIFNKDSAHRWFKANIKRIQERDLKNPPYPKPYYTSTNFTEALGRQLAIISQR